jgi:hypothetical protein
MYVMIVIQLFSFTISHIHSIYIYGCRLRAVQTVEKLQDEYQFFVLYYGNDIPKMKLALKATKKKQKDQQRLEEDPEMEQEVADDEGDTLLKKASRKSGYAMCLDAGLGRNHMSVIFVEYAWL